MYQSSVRSTTANSGRTALALVAILSLLLSLFAIVRPAIANHEPPGLEGPDVVGVVLPGNPPCPAGTTEIKFEGATLFDGSELSVVIDGQTVTATIFDVNVAAGTFSFTVDGGLAYYVVAKGGPNGTVYDYRPIDGVAHDDGLTTPINPSNNQPYGISHISICVVPVVTGSIVILKTDDSDAPLADVVFTVEGQEGTFTTGADGTFCVDGLTIGDVLTVTETAAPDGYTGAAPQDVTVTVEGDCDERGDAAVDATFVNTLIQEGSITIVKVEECDECDTRTIGYYFNRADRHEGETNALFGSGIEADGILFTNVDQVQAYIEADISGESDGQKGLSARGQLTIQYLAAQLNVARNGTDCDLANRVYNNPDSPFDSWTVQMILDEADAAFAGTSEYSDQEIQEALDDINNSSQADENPLSCEGDTDGAPLEGAVFEVYFDANGNGVVDEGEQSVGTLVSGPDGMDTLEVDAFGWYLLVETEAPEGCDLLEGPIAVEVTAEDSDVTVTIPNDCDGEQPEAGSLLIAKTDEAGDSLGGATFEVDGAPYSDDDGDGFVCVDGLTLGDTVSVEETIAPDGYIGEEGAQDVPVLSDADCDTRLAGEDPQADADVTFVNVAEEEEEGTLEIEKFYCPADEDGTQFIVSPPAPLESFGALQEEDAEGCSTGDATFSIENNETGETVSVSTGDDGLVEIDLADGEYTITETSTDEDPAPSATFTIEAGAITAVIVINSEGEDEEEGQIKIIKLFCDADEDSVTFTIEGGSQLPPSLENCELGDAAFQLNDGETFTIGADGIWFASVPVGSYTLSEVLPHQATSPSFDVELGEITTVIVVNNEGEGEGEGETVQVSIMKHLCADVATVAEFEAIEAAAAEENPDNAFAPLVATVLACPTIVATGDVPTEGAVSGGAVDFEFSVLDADGNQLLSEDGMFMQGALCETDVNLDADGDGEITGDVCLDISHYMFEVVDGLVVITETDAPANHRFGTIRFTPGSDDADALVGTIANVEATGVIVLDTTADGDDAVMVHAYNFVTEDTQGGGTPGQNETPREGTQGGNPLPNTATSPIPTGSVPAALLALLMLSGLGAAAYATTAEVRRRR